MCNSPPPPVLSDRLGDFRRQPRSVRAGRTPTVAVVVPVDCSTTAGGVQAALETTAAFVDEVLAMQARAATIDKLLADAEADPGNRERLKANPHAALPGVPSQAVIEETHAFSGADLSWHDFVVCLVVDGVDEASPAVMDHLAFLGLFDRDLMVSGAGDSDDDAAPLPAGAGAGHSKDATGSGMRSRQPLDGVGVLHVFERCALLPNVFLDKVHAAPLQVMVCVKEHAGGTLNSMWWFYHTLAKQLAPEFVAHVPCGAGMRRSTLPLLLRALMEDPDAGAVHPREAPAARPWRVWESAQAFAVTLRNCMTLPVQAMVGHIKHPSPTGVAMFRYEALRGTPVVQYLELEQYSLDHLSSCDVAQATVPSTLLSAEIVMKSNNRNVTKLVNKAVVEPALPTSLHRAIAAQEHVVQQQASGPWFFLRLLCTRKPPPSHKSGRKAALFFHALLDAVWTPLMWFAVALSYLVMAALFDHTFKNLSRCVCRGVAGVVPLELTSVGWLCDLMPCFPWSGPLSLTARTWRCCCCNCCARRCRKTASAVCLGTAATRLWCLPPPAPCRQEYLTPRTRTSCTSCTACGGCRKVPLPTTAALLAPNSGTPSRRPSLSRRCCPSAPSCTRRRGWPSSPARCCLR